MNSPTPSNSTISVNPNYALGQLAQAFVTSEQHPDEAARARALEKIQRWEQIFTQIMQNTVSYGSRTPLKDVPAWVTLEVAQGGFATGHLMAAGPLLAHEIELLQTLGVDPLTEPEPRLVLNRYFLSDAGFDQLQTWLQNGCYSLSVPEEGALLVVAWLMLQGHSEAARELVTTLTPFLARLRFYPTPAQEPQQFGGQVAVRTVAECVDTLNEIKAKRAVLAQKEAVTIWLPLYDRAVALMLETVNHDWPCQVYPEGWVQRAKILLQDTTHLRKQHTLCQNRHNVTKTYQAQLLHYLEQCAYRPQALTGLEVGRIRHILKTYRAKRGLPQSDTHLAARLKQQQEIAKPTIDQFAKTMIQRLNDQAPNRGLDNVEAFLHPITELETSQVHGFKAGMAMPSPILTRMKYARIDTPAALIKAGLITSGETLARVLPQMTAGLQTVGIQDRHLRPLYAAIYQAFRARRSLLLLNLAKQVQLEELPWLGALTPFRQTNSTTKDIARQALEEITCLVLTAFPQTIIPNKLLQELRALVKSAHLTVPLVDELAVDIFMGQFTEKFSHAVLMAGALLKDSLYARYYEIDYAALEHELTAPKSLNIFGRKPKSPTAQHNTHQLAAICAARAGVTLGTWRSATNGMIVEQQQILTTQNLAALWVGLKLETLLKPQLMAMAQHCFTWILTALTRQSPDYHSQLVAIKNSAYAWRQMIFFLSLLMPEEQNSFMRWANNALNVTPAKHSFEPIIQGLELALKGETPQQGTAKRFLGWSDAGHWLLTK